MKMDERIIVIILFLATTIVSTYYYSVRLTYHEVRPSSIPSTYVGTRVVIYGWVDSVEENGFRLCDEDGCVKVIGDQLVYEDDWITVYGWVSSYMGHKYVRLEEIR